MPSRYDRRSVAINNNNLYENVFRNRGVNFIKQYFTPNLRFPTDDEILQLNPIGYTLQIGDRYWKLAEKYYGYPELWWVIAWYNQLIFEPDNGTTIYIPLPLDKTLQFLGV
jgi:hypothetical protein